MIRKVTSPFSFTINYSRSNGDVVFPKDTIQYFVVSQDSSTPANIGTNSGTYAVKPSSVNLTSAAFPIGGNINSYINRNPESYLNLTMLMQGFYDPNSGTMISDTARVYLRSSVSPFAVIDSAKQFLFGGMVADSLSDNSGGSVAGSGIFTFLNATNGVGYYLQIKHRNSIETWSKTPQSFISKNLIYDFTLDSAKANG